MYQADGVKLKKWQLSLSWTEIFLLQNNVFEAYMKLLVFSGFVYVNVSGPPLSSSLDS